MPVLGNAEVDGLKRKLGAYLWPDNPLLHTTWEVGECLGTWWRPNFDTVFYPYIPPHISKPKESKKLFIVPLAEKARFGVSTWVTAWMLQGVCQLGSSATHSHALDKPLLAQYTAAAAEWAGQHGGCLPICTVS
jgi:hypothetical protein